MYERSYGDKYDSSLSGPEIAKRIRADIKAAIRAGTLSDGVYSVRYRSASMCQAIDVRVKHLPGVAILNPERIAFDALEWEQQRDQRTPDIYNDIGKSVLKTLERIRWAYNHDGSDSQIDYFDVNFYGSVGFSSRFERAERERITAGQPADATDPYVPSKRPKPKPRAKTSDFVSTPILHECDPIKVWGRTYTVERVDEDSQQLRHPIAYVLTSKRGAKITLQRYGADSPNMWPTNADIRRYSCPVTGEWFNDRSGTLEHGFFRAPRLKVVSA